MDINQDNRFLLYTTICVVLTVNVLKQNGLEHWAIVVIVKQSKEFAKIQNYKIILKLRGICRKIKL